MFKNEYQLEKENKILEVLILKVNTVAKVNELDRSFFVLLQGGPFVEIFSAQGKNPGTNWKVFGSPSVIGKEFDKEVKGFVFVLEGSSQTNKMQLPKETRQNPSGLPQMCGVRVQDVPGGPTRPVPPLFSTDEPVIASITEDSEA
ncbi:hypothetical protein EYD10_04635 [Varanus komodoensis]|nr:hypothetical protein EYD10_04635 [Varanus komodoensis]